MPAIYCCITIHAWGEYLYQGDSVPLCCVVAQIVICRVSAAGVRSKLNPSEITLAISSISVCRHAVCDY
jgi:hypothetical protein